MTGNASDKAAREEIWISFRSLLYVYLAGAAAATEIPEAFLLAEEPSSLQIVGAEHTVKLELRSETGEGYWAVFGKGENEGAMPLDEGAFRLGLDAQFEWSGKPERLEMDAVAEALAMLAI